MRVSALALALLLGSGVAWAQNGQSVIVIPPAPPIVSAPQAPAPPPAPEVPPAQVQSQTLPAVPPGQTGATQPASSAAPAANTQPPPPDVAPPPPNDWVPGHTAVLGVLNEVDGSTAQLSVPVGGQPAKAGDVLVSVQACATRPPQDLPDDAVFLTVQPANDSSAAPLYRGWMLRSAPGATVVGNAAETFRVVSCS